MLPFTIFHYFPTELHAVHFKQTTLRHHERQDNLWGVCFVFTLFCHIQSHCTTLSIGIDNEQTPLCVCTLTPEFFTV